MFKEIKARLFPTLPREQKLEGVTTNGQKIKIKLGNNLSIDKNGLEYTINAEGGGGEITPETLLENMEGSDYISVDLNEDESKVIVELDQTKVDTEVTEDSENLVTSGAVFNGLSDKVDIPRDIPSEFYYNGDLITVSHFTDETPITTTEKTVLISESPFYIVNRQEFNPSDANVNVLYFGRYYTFGDVIDPTKVTTAKISNRMLVTLPGLVKAYRRYTHFIVDGNNLSIYVSNKSSFNPAQSELMYTTAQGWLSSNTFIFFERPKDDDKAMLNDIGEFNL